MDFTEKANETARASLELLYHVSRELAAALDLRTVLQRVLFLSMKNVNAISGSIIVVDDNGSPIESAMITGSQVHNHTTHRLRAILDHGLAGWVARNRQPVLLTDTSQDERWILRPYDLGERTNPKSAVSTPILVRERLVGVVTLVHPTAGFFTEDHLALVQAIADQAGIAILNARLYEESQRRARVMTAIAESMATITASLNLEDVLQRIMEQIIQALRVDVVSLALIDPQGDLLYCAATGDITGSVVGMQVPMGKGVAGWVAKEGRGVVIPDASKDSRYFPEIDEKLNFKTRAIACAPIRSGGEVIGVLEALNPLDGTFDPDALLVLTGVGSLAGTAIRHAQLFESLQAAHQRYRELFEDSIDPIIVTDWDGAILEANRQAEITTGLLSQDLRNLNIADLHDMDQKKVGERFENLTGGKMITYESTLKLDAEFEFPVDVHARKVLIEGEPHLQWILRDITERKNLDTMREDLLSMIYHDLRSPLANIVSSMDVLASMLTEQSNDPALHSLLNIAVRSTDRIQRLTNSLLDINRMEAGQSVGNRMPGSPSTLITEAVEIVSPIAMNKSLEIMPDIAPDLPDVFADADMIRRVLINLLENAVKFTPPGGKIYLGARQEGGYVHIWVNDNGPGIPPSERERIFDKFARLHTGTLKQAPKGLGLGLAYCRLAVEGHGGRIWVDSAPDTGSSFNFTLPVALRP